MPGGVTSDLHKKHQTKGSWAWEGVQMINQGQLDMGRSPSDEWKYYTFNQKIKDFLFTQTCLSQVIEMTVYFCHQKLNLASMPISKNILSPWAKVWQPPKVTNVVFNNLNKKLKLYQNWGGKNLYIWEKLQCNKYISAWWKEKEVRNPGWWSNKNIDWCQ